MNVQGADAVRTIIGTIRTMYDGQDYNYAGPWGDNSFLEDHTAQVRGEPIGYLALVTYNAAGQTQHIAANYRPRSSLLFLSRLLGEKFASTPIGEHSSPARREIDNRFRSESMRREEPLRPLPLAAHPCADASIWTG
jgi:hypothetical protein